MFFNLAWRNSKRNRSENLIYFLTMVTAIATFYIVLSLGSQDVMSSVPINQPRLTF